MLNVDQEYLDGVVDCIKNTLPVKEVILFGSRARGDQNHNSDYDICVITESLTERKLLLLQKIYHALIPYAYHSVDVILYTQQEFMERSQNRSFERSIAREGVRMYVAA